MNHLPHYLLILVAVALNLGNRRMLALSLIIGFSLLIPVNQFTDWQSFYPVCAIFEILWALCAWHLRARASSFATTMYVMLLAYHINGWYLGGYPNQSPYWLLVPICEYAEILACCLFSNPIWKRIKQNDRARNRSNQ